ncbi:MAG: TIGR02391 family protein [Candidatus Pacearchaeota archaeon]
MKTVNRITAKKAQDISNLAEALGKIIPATSLGKFSFKSIAESRSITKKYWKKGVNKRTMISGFLIDVIRYHPKMLYKIIRENIHAGIDRRHKSGHPVLKKEVDEIVELLANLGFDMKKELEELNLPTERPNIVPPPFEYQQIVQKISLESDIDEKCKQLFLDGHINESVRKAFEIFEKKVQDFTGLEDKGKVLMMKAFDENQPLITVADVNTKDGKSFQEGFRFMAAGCMLFLRNKFSHGDVAQESHIDGFQMLLTANQLLREVNKSQD